MRRCLTGPTQSPLSLMDFVRGDWLSVVTQWGWPPWVKFNLLVLGASSLSRLWTCPNHLNLFSLRNSAIGNMSASFRMSSSTFLTLSSLVSPLALRSMCISVVCNFISSFLLTAQHSAPYTMAGFISVLPTLCLSTLLVCSCRTSPQYFPPTLARQFLFCCLHNIMSLLLRWHHTMNTDTWTFSLSSLLFRDCR